MSLSYLKSKQIQKEKIDALEKTWLYLDNLQVVSKRLIKLWIEIEYTIKAYDELNMCKMRISLTEDPNEASAFKILKHEIDQRIIDHQTQLFAAEKELVKKVARLRYINHLKSEEEMGSCPICQLVDQVRVRYVVKPNASGPLIFFSFSVRRFRMWSSYLSSMLKINTPICK